MTTILVTGGAGYIGSHTCKALASKGLQPLVYDNLSEGHAEFVKWGELVVGDVRDVERLDQVFKRYQPDAVIHFAASAYVGESIKQPQRYYENNVAGSVSLLTAMQKNQCQNIVFSSTCAVYGQPDSLPINLQTKPKPINPYGRSKLMVEQVLQDSAAAWGLNSVALRYFNAAGADAQGEIGERHIPETHLLPNAIGAALGNFPPLQIFGADYATPDGTCVRDYVHVADLAAGHVRALDYLQEKRGFHRFNLGSGQGWSVQQIVDEVSAYVGTPVPHKVEARRPGDPAELVADISQTVESLGWRPACSDLQTIVRSAVDWARLEATATNR